MPPNKVLDLHKLQGRCIRARSAIGRGTRYKLSKGGFHPFDALPTKDGHCDCSGFVAWAIGMDRWQGRHTKPWSAQIPWIETTAIVQDAKGKQRLFKQIERPVPGCIVVYGDRIGRQGHVGLVDSVRSATDFDVIHCSVGNDRSGDAIQRTNGRLFVKAKAIFCVLNEDYENVIVTTVEGAL